MKNLHGRLFLCCVCSVLLVNNVKTELFTALMELEKVLRAEALIADDIENYIALEQDRLNKLKSIAEDFHNHSQSALADLDHHLGNPVNSYLLIKRFTRDWAQVESLIRDGPVVDLLTTIDQRRKNFPTEDDLKGAAAALLRLQDTYQLPAEKIANGDLQGVQIHTKLSAVECYEIGRSAYITGDYYHTILWMEESLDRIRDEVNRTVDEADILDHLSYSNFQQGNVRKALVLTDELLAIVPDHERALGNKRYYETVIAQQEAQAEKKGDDLPVETNQNKRQLDEYRNSQEFFNYESLCRGEDVIPNPDIHKLKCFYTHKNNPRRYLKPFKEEEAYLNPRIVVFHDVITDAEIDLVKKMAGPRLNRATIQNPNTGKLEFAPYRISKSAWLKTYEAPFLETLEQRVADFTQLNMEVAEELQVVNYGIGGHYEPHYDFARKEEVNAFKSLGTGNRIATVLFYMSDVEAGGATVFTNIGVKVFPKKGTAAFWHNLYKNGQGNFDTRHAACPVLTGSKWVSNRWIHERGQEFTYPCSLNQNE